MRFDIHVHHHAAPVDTRVLDKIDLMLAQQELIMELIDRLLADVAAQATVITSMQTFISNLKHVLADALSGATLPPDVAAKLAAVMPALEANTDAISAAITENTAPAAPAPADPSAPLSTSTASTDPAASSGPTDGSMPQSETTTASAT